MWCANFWFNNPITWPIVFSLSSFLFYTFRWTPLIQNFHLDFVLPGLFFVVVSTIFFNYISKIKYGKYINITIFSFLIITCVLYKPFVIIFLYFLSLLFSLDITESYAGGEAFFYISGLLIFISPLILGSILLKKKKVSIIILVSTIVISFLIILTTGTLAYATDKPYFCGFAIGGYPYNYKEFCYLDMAENLDELSLCNKIKDEDHGIKCIKVMAAGLQNPLKCNDLIDLYYREFCYSSVVVYTLDHSLCDMNITDTKLKDRCIKGLAQELNDSSLCNEIQDSYNRESCYSLVAVNALDYSLCSVNITKPLAKDGCLRGLAKKLHNSSIYYETIKRDTCFYELAQDLNNTSLCNEIQDSFDRKLCINVVTGNSSIPQRF